MTKRTKAGRHPLAIDPIRLERAITLDEAGAKRSRELGIRLQSVVTESGCSKKEIVVAISRQLAINAGVMKIDLREALGMVIFFNQHLSEFFEGTP